MPESAIQKECLNPLFRAYVNEYFDLLLDFMNAYQPLGREFTVFLTNQAFELFLFLDDEKKTAFVRRLGVCSNFDLFSIFNFFLVNWEPDRMSALVLHKEGNDIIGQLVVFFFHALKQQARFSTFSCEGFSSSNPLLAEKFVGFLECKGFSTLFSREFVERLFRQKLAESSREEVERFAVLLLDTLRNDCNLLYYDFISIVVVLLQLSTPFINSDLMLKALCKNENK